MDGWDEAQNYKASFTIRSAPMPTSTAVRANARAWYTRAQEAVPFINHTLANPPIDRNKAADDVKDVYVSIQKRPTRDLCFRQRWWRLSSALTNYQLLLQNMAAEITAR